MIIIRIIIRIRIVTLKHNDDYNNKDTEQNKTTITNIKNNEGNDKELDKNCNNQNNNNHDNTYNIIIHVGQE